MMIPRRCSMHRLLNCKGFSRKRLQPVMSLFHLQQHQNRACQRTHHRSRTQQRQQPRLLKHRHGGGERCCRHNKKKHRPVSLLSQRYLPCRWSGKTKSTTFKRSCKAIGQFPYQPQAHQAGTRLEARREPVAPRVLKTCRPPPRLSLHRLEAQFQPAAPYVSQAGATVDVTREPVAPRVLQPPRPPPQLSLHCIKAQVQRRCGWTS